MSKQKMRPALHTLAIVAAILVVPIAAVAIKPFLTQAIQMPAGANIIPLGENGIYNAAETPTWVYQDGGTTSMLGGGGGGSGTVTSITCTTPAVCTPTPLVTTGVISHAAVGTAGSYGSASSVPVVTTNATGHVSGVVPTAIVIAESSVTNLVTDLAAKGGLAVANTWSASQNVGSVALSDGATIATNAALGNSFGVTIGASRIMGLPTNLVSGGTYQWEIIQGGAGSFLITWNAIFKWPGGSAPTLLTAAGAKDLISCYYDGTDLLCGSLAGGGAGGSSYYQTVQDEGSGLAQEPILNFAGAGITCAPGSGKTTCTVPNVGTVTSVACGAGLTCSTAPIIATGTITPDVAVIATFTDATWPLATNTVVTTGSAATNTTGLAIKSTVADGATSVPILLEATTAVPSGKVVRVNNGATVEVASILSDFGSTIHEWRGANAIWGFRNSNGTGILAQSSIIYEYIAGVAYSQFSTTSYRPSNDGTQSLGIDGARWQAAMVRWHDTGRGAQLTAASTITPTTGLHHVTGATTINIIAATNVPSSGNVYLTLIADTAITLGSSGSAGGIKTAPAALAQDKAITLVYDSATTFWYVVQGG